MAREGRTGSERIEHMNERVDSLADRFTSDGSADAYGDWEASRHVLGFFPIFIVACVVFWIAITAYLGSFSFESVISNLCLVFIGGFAILGMIVVWNVPKGPFPMWFVFVAAVFLALVQWIVGDIVDYFVYTQAVQGIFRFFGVTLDGSSLFMATFLVTIVVMFFTTYGVMYVTTGYLRKYLVKVFVQMQDHARTGVRGKAEAFFQVPEIIDVREVVLEPESDLHRFSFRSMVSLSTSMVVLGILVSSYLFINPLFLQVMSWKSMLSIMMMLSIFIPVLIVPWQISQGVGAKVRSDAPRDYYLWEGARKRLFSVFFAMGVFMVFFVLSVYIGVPVTDMLITYVAFIVPLLLSTFMSSFVYANNFYNPLRSSICNGFEKERGGKGPED